MQNIYTRQWKWKSSKGHDVGTETRGTLATMLPGRNAVSCRLRCTMMDEQTHPPFFSFFSSSFPSCVYIYIYITYFFCTLGYSAFPPVLILHIFQISKTLRETCNTKYKFVYVRHFPRIKIREALFENVNHGPFFYQKEKKTKEKRAKFLTGKRKWTQK